MTELRRYEYGPGEHKSPGYIGVDMAPTDIQVDSVEAIFNPVCGPGEASEILSIHFIEHFVRADVERLVGMWRGMLATGGLLITCFPDLEAMSADMTIRRQASMIRRPLDHAWGMALPGDPQGLYRHRSFWTAAEYMELLTRVGFTSIKQVHYERLRHDLMWTSEIRAVA